MRTEIGTTAVWMSVPTAAAPPGVVMTNTFAPRQLRKQLVVSY